MSGNNEYTRLAYRRAIIVALMAHLRTNYMPLTSNRPNETVTCEDVPRAIETVPIETISEVIEELEIESQTLLTEMAKYKHTRQEEQHGLLSISKAAKGSNQSDHQGRPQRSAQERGGRRAR